MFVAVKAGKNKCEICYEYAFYDLQVPRRENFPNDTKVPKKENCPNEIKHFELLSCGHGICESCYEQLQSNSCPFCRKKEHLLVEMFSKKTQSYMTFSEFVEGNDIYDLKELFGWKFGYTKFAKLHKEIYQKYKTKKIIYKK